MRTVKRDFELQFDGNSSNRTLYNFFLYILNLLTFLYFKFIYRPNQFSQPESSIQSAKKILNSILFIHLLFRHVEKVLKNLSKN